ncbi:MAG TPA: DUF718 domain-containing protein [Casimicrobiaceae bacterium]|nr:DUF718 domain-containing protein [Casimicrobiaceae bacterium]
MTAFNVVRFKVKPGSEQQFIEGHRMARPGFKGFLGASLIRTGDQTFCFVGEWRNFDSIVAARPQMIAMLDGMRDLLEDLGGGLGVTDPVSGQAVVKLAPPKPAKKRSAKRRPATKRAKAKRPARKRKR